MLAPVWIEHSVLPLTTHFKVFARVGWLFATTFGFGVLIKIIIRFLRRVYAHTAEEELTRNEARRPIFYLRSFSLEVWDKPTLRMLLQDDTTAEQKMVNVLKNTDPLSRLEGRAKSYQVLARHDFMSPTISGSKKSQT